MRGRRRSMGTVRDEHEDADMVKLQRSWVAVWRGMAARGERIRTAQGGTELKLGRG
jgi:hypothetical protein